MSARADANRTERAANALRILVAAIRTGGDVKTWSHNAARILTRRDGREWDPATLVALGVDELVALAERLDRYVESVR